ncbi:ribonuclease R family protein [Adlercreutzia sp. ZJ473]|uniref:ribonuclease R family protein n=1 Tax=Adlercreutzia sp. ZJ473 TaxID=2722822 RepID=UPI0015580722|nr:RNB domain-containing ribonuclease [Adlercreutzia sp. ZJ473]
MGRTRSHTRRTPRSHPRGVLVARAGGFGFVQTAEGEYFVPAACMNGAFDGDLVEVAPIERKGASKRGGHGAGGFGGGAAREGGKPAARVLRVVDRAHDTVVGRYEVAEPFGVVVPVDVRIPYDIFTMRSDYPGIEDGSLVRVRITQFPTRRTSATGVVEEVLGRADAPSMGVDVIVARHKLETTFSPGALEEARDAQVDAAGALAAGYRDLRERFVFTIDPADARDFDDALSLEPVGADGEADAGGEARAGGEADAGMEALAAGEAAGAGSRAGAARWRLGVHIADVSHYVPWNSSIDLDARRRATSVYLVDRVIPMLPPELSDDLCSLRPGEDRRAMTVDLYLDDEARLVSYDAYPSLIRSNVRLSYDEALALLERDAANTPLAAPADAEGSGSAANAEGVGSATSPASPDLVRRLRACARIAQMRASARERAGGIDFATTEAKVRLDEDGAPLAVELRVKNAATMLVEEAMILANETVAAHLAHRRWPCAFRVHEQPAPDALGGLVPVFQEFPWFDEGLAARLVTGDPHAIQAILAAASGRAEGELVSSLLLRSMKRALYRPENAGHYGLASAAYCHFTSPIRRYPDLVAHRMLRASLTRRPEKFDQEVSALPWICEHASDMERIADAAARESQELKMVEYLQQFVGTAFPGVVSGVASYGLYVRLECTAEGLLPVRALGEEYFAFDPVRYTLTGSDTGAVFRLGQRVAVVLKAAEPLTGKLDLALAKGRGRRA